MLPAAVERAVSARCLRDRAVGLLQKQDKRTVFAVSALRFDTDAAHIGAVVVDIEIAELVIAVKRRDIKLVVVFSQPVTCFAPENTGVSSSYAW